MPATHRKQAIAAVIGNALEWYDFVVFGFLTVIISRLFFPDDNELLVLLKTTATFGVGFLMRPIGGIVLGLYADRCGRKAALQLIMGLMTLALLLIATAPPYAAIGQVIALLFLSLAVPLFGALSDRVGRRPVLICGCVLLLLALYPLFARTHDAPGFTNLLIMQVSLCSLLGVYYGPLSTAVQSSSSLGYAQRVCRSPTILLSCCSAASRSSS